MHIDVRIRQGRLASIVQHLPDSAAFTVPLAAAAPAAPSSPFLPAPAAPTDRAGDTGAEGCCAGEANCFRRSATRRGGGSEALRRVPPAAGLPPAGESGIEPADGRPTERGGVYTCVMTPAAQKSELVQLLAIS